MEILERLIALEERTKSNTKRLNEAEKRLDKNEQVINSIDKSLSITIEQIKNIAEDLKATSINFKEAIMRSNTANNKETEILKEKYNELEKKYEKLDSKIEKETVLKDAENWRTSKKQILCRVLVAILTIVASVLGISKFL